MRSVIRQIASTFAGTNYLHHPCSSKWDVRGFALFDTDELFGGRFSYYVLHKRDSDRVQVSLSVRAVACCVPSVPHTHAQPALR